MRSTTSGTDSENANTAAESEGARAWHERFRAGDRVRIDRNNVYCRAWMSTSAPIIGTRQRGDVGTMLKGPVRSDGHYWAKVQFDQPGQTGFVSARYLELVESSHLPLHAEPLLSDAPAPKRERYRTGDRLATDLSLELRSGPGIHHGVVQTLPMNDVGLVLGEPVTADSVPWVPARFRTGEGWLAMQHTVLFIRNGKWIEVDLAAHHLVAWEASESIADSPVNNGKPGYRTPMGVFSITAKFPTRRMRARVRGEEWDYAAVPWALRFRHGGFYLHSSYWQDDFGVDSSHGCVNMPVAFAEWLYDWTPIGTRVWIHS